MKRRAVSLRRLIELLVLYYIDVTSNTSAYFTHNQSGDIKFDGKGAESHFYKSRHKCQKEGVASVT